MIGWFGKIPAAPDFIVRHLDEALAQRLADWLESSVASYRQTAGADWQSLFLQAPQWRFLLAPGVISPQAMIGVITPSIDAVGRCYPCVFGKLLAEHWAQQLVLADVTAWFAQLESIALQAVGQRWDSQQIDGELERLKILGLDELNMPFDAQARRLATEWHQHRPMGAPLGLPAELPLNTLAQQLGSLAFERLFAGQSVWWERGQGHEQYQMRRFQGLPNFYEFSLLMSPRASATAPV
ncbi:hypothetical protein SAMN02745857_02033 [Andreprevotia lacus DSM 23236]|uniref:Type VI secretion system protein ImpM n=1 Tax=Andreprevotia lacus DSM 23236 TaxID=1121001 RepID=A0A1W1XMC0_9NEIS|nr:type VI secretion system-associated protein TagF [Andreprevotia lacus]SMC25012.1 hypothetical protein SAMN02745857_02033 [Andreprevotia lacus DSM 23236]